MVTIKETIVRSNAKASLYKHLGNTCESCQIVTSILGTERFVFLSLLLESKFTYPVIIVENAVCVQLWAAREKD